MSSLRNAVKRKTHKERSQPSDRKRLGLLEKHKDYVLRAQDYNKKHDRLRKLRLKAAFRNPDEFYHKMIQGQTKDGIHVSANSHGTVFSHEEMQVMKTQDMAYFHMVKTIDRKKADKLKESLHFINAPKKNKHTIFVDSAEQVQSFDPVKHFDTVPELVDNAHNRLRRSKLKAVDIPDVSTSESYTQYQEMFARYKRAGKLDIMRQKLEVHRNLQGKGSRIKVQEGDEQQPAVYRWKRQRLK